jgi:hypothetical protein
VRMSGGNILDLDTLLELYVPHVRRADTESFSLWLAQLPTLADNAA